MTQREIVVRLCEAYVNAGVTVEIEKIIKIADYIMSHTNDYNYTQPQQYVTYLKDNSALLKTINADWNAAYSSAENSATSSAIDNSISTISDITL